MTDRQRSPLTTAAVRRAAHGDLAAVAEILQRSFAEFRADYTPAAWQATVPGTAALRARLHEGPVWLAAAGALAFGTVAARFTPAGVYLRSMAVVPEARGTGLATSLVDTVERWARARGAARVWLSTTPFLHAAIRLYGRRGFAPSDDGPAELHGVPLLGMAKSLAPDALNADR